MVAQPSAAPADLGAFHMEYRRPVEVYVLLGFIAAVPFGFLAWEALARLNLLIGAILGASGVSALIFALQALFTMPRRIAVHEEGMVVETIVGRRVVGWATITTVRARQFPTGQVVAQNVDARTSDGYRLVLSGLPGTPRQPANAPAPRVGVDGVIQAVCGASAATRLAALTAQYEAGQPVDFGRFQLSREGFRVGGRALAWSALADIQADRSLMVLKAAGQERPWATFELEKVLNADILPELIAAVQGTGYSAYQETGEMPDLEAARRAIRRRERVVSWLLVPLLLVIVNVVVRLGLSLP